MKKELQELSDHILRCCVCLMPPFQPDLDYIPLYQLGEQRTLHDFESGIFSLQHYHLDFSKREIEKFNAKGVLAHVVTIPMSEEGCLLRVAPFLDEADANTHDGHLVYVPEGHAFIQPMTMAHAGGFRTGHWGNPRLHMVVFMVPVEHEKDLGSIIPGEFTQCYFGSGQVEGIHCHDLYDFTKLDKEQAPLSAPSPIHNRPWLRKLASLIGH